MLISEIINESPRMTRQTIVDNYGGIIKIEPDPSTTSYPSKFSIAYINPVIASFYKVNDRLIGLDSHAHIREPQPHLHLLSKSKSHGYIESPIQIIRFPFREIINLFFSIYNALINCYIKDIK